MFAIEAPPRVCRVLGDVIREKIRLHIKQLDAALLTIEEAIFKNREGADWHCLEDELKDRRRAAEYVLPAIGEGPHEMTMEQWLSICNRFADVRTAEEIVANKKKQEAHRAAHTPLQEGKPS